MRALPPCESVFDRFLLGNRPPTDYGFVGSLWQPLLWLPKDTVWVCISCACFKTADSNFKDVCVYPPPAEFIQKCHCVCMSHVHLHVCMTMLAVKCDGRLARCNCQSRLRHMLSGLFLYLLLLFLILLLLLLLLLLLFLGRWTHLEALRCTNTAHTP